MATATKVTNESNKIVDQFYFIGSKSALLANKDEFNKFLYAITFILFCDEEELTNKYLAKIFNIKKEDVSRWHEELGYLDSAHNICIIPNKETFGKYSHYYSFYYGNHYIRYKNYELQHKIIKEMLVENRKLFNTINGFFSNLAVDLYKDSYGKSIIPLVGFILTKIYLKQSLNQNDKTIIADKILGSLVGFDFNGKKLLTNSVCYHQLVPIIKDPQCIGEQPISNIKALYDGFVQYYLEQGYDDPCIAILRKILLDHHEPINELDAYTSGKFSANVEFPEQIILESFLSGQFDATISLINTYHKAKKKENNGIKYTLPYYMDLMLQYSRIMANVDLPKMRKEVSKIKDTFNDVQSYLNGIYTALEKLEQKRLGEDVSFDPRYLGSRTNNAQGAMFGQYGTPTNIVAPVIFAGIVSSFELETEDLKVPIQLYYQDLVKNRPTLAKWFAKTLSNIIDIPKEDIKEESFDFTNSIDKTKVWKNQILSLNEILQIETEDAPLKVSKGKAKSKKEKHLAWMMDQTSGKAEPYVVEYDPKDDSFIFDKFLSYRDLLKNKFKENSWLLDQDRLAISAFNIYGSERRNTLEYSYNYIMISRALLEHPYFFIADNKEYPHVEFLKGKIRITLKESPKGWKVTMDEKTFGNDEARFYYDRDNKKLYFIECTDTYNALKKLISDKGQIFPKEAFGDLAYLSKSQEIQIDFDIKAKKVKADSTLVVMLSNFNKTYGIKLRIKPIPNVDSHIAIPGMGDPEIIFNDQNNVPSQAVRDLEAEKAHMEVVLGSTPIFNQIDKDDEDDETSYETESLEDVLEIMEVVNNLKGIARIEWSDKRNIKVSNTIGSKNFKFFSEVDRQNWLELSGEIYLDETKFLSLKIMLEALDGTSGRFVKIDDENYVALTTELKKKLERIKAVTQVGKGNKLLAHPLASAAFEDVVKDLDIKVGDSLKDLLKKREEAMSYMPTLPKNLQADLRPYQMEGFIWLCRLIKWGVGGCLADDMGLGKTVQTIAAMLTIAKNGPCLVVAPTSVCPNWELELNKFAPTLTVKRLKEADDRKELVESMQKNQVLIVSYGLFAIESEIISSKQWEFAAFDEAQALKNDFTKRAKAASEINAKTIIALTGTPIENDLDDLWSIFNVINAGLLGTKKHFHQRFGDVMYSKQANRTLKLLISPFILRRLKNDVLQDLPPRTEQCIVVEQSKKEKEIYETMRRKTMQDLEKIAHSVAPGQRRLQILAALTRLRQICCDSSLLDEQFNFGMSSKTQAFLDLLDEALSGGHRLLVFSQFVGYLTKIRSALNERKISYQYLDGQTTERKRKEAIEAFQAGEGDVFLISLRAGGQGLNLTAADYVIHLDPWWNPAVEDQATDRAYRIGQTRPVNVFRLVMENSIEEKILALHAQKRELAADFLSGTSDMAAESMSLSEEELLNLIN